MQRLWKLFGGAPTAREVRFASVAVLIISVLFTVAAALIDARGIRVGSYTLGGDFAAFYAAGVSMNHYSYERVYDPSLQYELQRKLRPNTQGAQIFGYPPFVALAFQAIARLPYIWAYLLFITISTGFYLAGLFVIWPREKVFAPFSGIAFMAAISFPPFLVECIAGGQLSPIGFFGFAACIGLERKRRDFWAGVALSLCLYKPTLLLLAMPMALVSRRLRLLGGFAAGACGFAAVSLYTFGLSGCAAWLHSLRTFGAMVTSQQEVLRTFKYVDISAFLRLLVSGHAPIRFAIQATISAAGFAWLGAAWWRWRKAVGSTDLLWAATLAWTLVLGAYVPIYDTTLVVISVLLIAGTFRAERDLEEFGALIALLYMAAWVTQPIARATGFQIFTPLLAGVGILAVRAVQPTEVSQLWAGDIERDCL
jgi:hypothetical protein